jgi:hypothetical protein
LKRYKNINIFIKPFIISFVKINECWFYSQLKEFKMKSNRIAVLLMLLALLVETFQAYAQGRGFRNNQKGRCYGYNFVDANGDGICDNRQNNFFQGGQQGNGNGQRIRLRSFVDENGDGICDNWQNNISQGRHRGNGTGQGLNRTDGIFISRPYPNPFSSTTNFDVNLPKDGNASIVLTDLNGKIIREIYKGNLTKGTHNFKLEGTNLQAGKYFIVLKFDGKTFSRPVHYLP